MSCSHHHDGSGVHEEFATTSRQSCDRAEVVVAGRDIIVASMETSNSTSAQPPSFALTCATGLQGPSLPSRPTAAFVIRTKTCRLSTMLVLTFSFFLVEIIVGFVTNSLALVSDSYHMLSDVLALCIGIASVRISKLDTRKNTYGWARAEVLGALVNSVFLIALCFTIFIEAIQRLTTDEVIEQVNLMLYVGIAGLAINVVGLALFHNDAHGHSHGGGGGHGHHGHSHHQEAEESDDTVAETSSSASTLEVVTVNERHDAMDSSDISENPVDGSDEQSNSTTHSGHKEPKKKKITSSAQLNMRGVFLHVLGDALGSVVVIVSALVIKFTDVSWKYKIDPAMSLVMVTIILSTTIPLLKESALILMQTVPTHIQVPELKQKLISSVSGVLAVHEFHVWQLAGNRIVASAHIRCINQHDYMRIAEKIKSFFHNEGIHSTTIQPEFVECEEETSLERDCVLECGPDKSCFIDTCCARKKQLGVDQQQTAGDLSSTGLRQRTNCSPSQQQQTSSDVVVDAVAGNASSAAASGCRSPERLPEPCQPRNDNANCAYSTEF